VKYSDGDLLNRVRSLPGFRGWPKGVLDIWLRSAADQYDRFDDKVYTYDCRTGDPIFKFAHTGTSHPGAGALQRFRKYNKLGAEDQGRNLVLDDVFRASGGGGVFIAPSEALLFWRWADEPTETPVFLGTATMGRTFSIPFDFQGGREIELFAIPKTAQGEQGGSVALNGETIRFTPNLSTAIANGNDTMAGIDRSNTGLTPSGQRIEQDTAALDTTDITPSILKQAVIEDGETIDTRIGIAFETGASHNNADTVGAVEIGVFDQFGDQIEDNQVFDSNNKGGVFSLVHDRKYADALEDQSYYAIRVQNNVGWSSPVYLQGSTKSTTEPTAKVPANCPKDFTASAISDVDVQLGYVFTGNVDLYRKEPKGTVWSKHNGSSITSSPNTQSGFTPGKKYELQFRSTSDGTNRSNIVQVTMPPQTGAAPTYAAPTNADGAVDATTPKSKLNFWCTSGANVQTKVFVGGIEDGSSPLGAVAVGQLINFSISSLGEGVSKSVKFQHDHGGGNLSDFTEEITRTTDVTPPAATKPSGETAFFSENGDGTGDATLSWVNNGGDGNWTVERKIGSGGTPQELINNHSSPTTSYVDAEVLQTGSARSLFYRVKDNDIGTGDDAFTSWAEVVIPAFNPHQ